MASFDQLANLAAHDRLRKHVREIVYDTRKFQVLKGSRKSPASVSSQKFQATYLGPSCATAELALLTRAFRSLPALNTFCIPNGVVPWWHDNRYVPRCVEQALKGTSIHNNNFKFLQGSELSQKCASVILAALAAGLDIHKYDGPSPYPATDSDEKADDFTARLLHEAFSSFKAMSLRYALMEEYPQDDSKWVREQQAVATKISSNPALEHLSITNFRYLHGYFNPQFDFGRLLGEDDVFPNLKSLSFCSIRVSQTALEGFLLRHSTTLRSIRLADIQLAPGGKDADGYDLICTWPEFLSFLQKDLSLRAVAFDGCLSTADNLESWEVSVSQKLRYFRRVLKKTPNDSAADNHQWVKDLEIDEAGDPVYDEEHCMKIRIENWIMDGLGDCPLELARNVPNSGSQTLQRPASWKSDYSWRCHWLDGHLDFSTVECVKSKSRK
jgi:hypothetical protein